MRIVKVSDSWRGFHLLGVKLGSRRKVLLVGGGGVNWV